MLGGSAKPVANSDLEWYRVPSGMWLEFLRGVISGKIVIAYYAASSIG